MPLLIKLAPAEKIVINGVVIDNAGGATALRILNQAHVLREKDILTFQEADTPAKRVFYALQCRYLFSDNQKESIESAQALMIDFVTAVPSSEPLIRNIVAAVERDELYQALKAARKLIEYERRILEDVATQ